MERVTHFEIPSSEPEKSLNFYSSVFGWNYQQWGDEKYWLAMTGPAEKPGINGAIMLRKDKNQPIVNTVSVNDIQSTIKKIEENGGKIVVPVMPIPGMGWLAYFKDLDENIFGIMQEDKNAK